MSSKSPASLDSMRVVSLVSSTLALHAPLRSQSCQLPRRLSQCSTSVATGVHVVEILHEDVYSSCS